MLAGISTGKVLGIMVVCLVLAICFLSIGKGEDMRVSIDGDYNRQEKTQNDAYDGIDPLTNRQTLDEFVENGPNKTPMTID